MLLIKQKVFGHVQSIILKIKVEAGHANMKFCVLRPRSIIIKGKCIKASTNIHLVTEQYTQDTSYRR